MGMVDVISIEVEEEKMIHEQKMSSRYSGCYCLLIG
jgi:hypothetical protein